METERAAELIPGIDPFDLFERWFREARQSEANDGNAVALATATPDGRPSVRMVLLKGYDREGFVFYTNTSSRKGRELEANADVALLFHWKSLRRQIRIEGEVVPVEEATADAYFSSRTRDSQLGAVASEQSARLDARATLLERFEEARVRFAEQAVERPPHWSGYRVIPSEIEFWLDRPHRLHERRRYRRVDGDWTNSLLYP